MNERIKELMKKAMVKTADMSRPGRKELDPEKFAELLVGECINILETRKNHAVIVNSIKEVKEHFGVE